MNEPRIAETPPRKRGPKRSRIQRAADLALVERLALRGESQTAIAAAVAAARPYQISRQMVGHDLGRLAKQWEVAALDSFASAKAKALRRIDEVEHTAWQSFDHSRESGDGNPAFLRLVIDAHDRRAKMLGLEAPTRAEISGPEGRPVAIETNDLQAALDPQAKLEILRRHVQRMEEAGAPQRAAL